MIWEINGLRDTFQSSFFFMILFLSRLEEKKIEKRENKKGFFPLSLNWKSSNTSFMWKITNSLSITFRCTLNPTIYWSQQQQPLNKSVFIRIKGVREKKKKIKHWLIVNLSKMEEVKHGGYMKESLNNP